MHVDMRTSHYRNPEYFGGAERERVNHSTKEEKSTIHSPVVGNLSKAIANNLDDVQSVHPHDIAEPKLTYRGGKLLENPSFVSVFLGKYWQTEDGAAERTYHDSFTKQFVTGDYTGIWQQYGVGKGKFLGSAVADASGSPKRITDSQIQKLVESEVKKNQFTGVGDETVYTVYLPPGTVLELEDGYSSLDGVGGYHGSYDRANGERVYYSALVYSEGQNGIEFTSQPRENMTITASHELTEAVTDPDVNNGKLGWYDDRYGEVADIPLSLGLPLESIYSHLDGYLVQKEWSEKDQTFEVRPKTSKAILSLASA